MLGRRAEGMAFNLRSQVQFRSGISEIRSFKPHNCESRGLIDLDPDVLDTIFEVFVRDFSALAIELHGKASSTDAQQQWALDQVRKPAVDTDRLEKVWKQVKALSGAYKMSP